MNRVASFVVASTFAAVLASSWACAAPVPVVTAADPAIVGPPPAPSLYEQAASTRAPANPSPSPPPPHDGAHR